MGMELWQQVDWKYPLEKSSLNAFSRIFRVKLSKLDVLGEVAPVLFRSRFWISFDHGGSVYSAVNELVEHLVESYGLEVVMKDRALYKTAGQRTWDLPTDPKQGGRAMAALKQAEPMIEPRPFVKNGSSDTLGWAVFSSSDWAELEAADLYATRALFPLKGAVPRAPALPRADASRRQRTPEHEELLAWVGANKDELTLRLVAALEKLETSHPDSAEERDAMSQIYRVQRRARR
jgi:hypothetical protein